MKLCTKNEGQLISFCYVNKTGELYKEYAGFRFLLEHRFRRANLARGVKELSVRETGELKKLSSSFTVTRMTFLRDV